MSNPIVHFEIPVDDVARAKAFYEKIFGWEIKLFPMPPGAPEYWGVTTKKKGEEGINGGLTKRMNVGQVFSNYITVTNMDSFLSSIQANGGQVLMPKTEISPGMGWIALFKDTENNVMGLHEMGPRSNPAPAKKKAPPKKKRR